MDAVAEVQVVVAAAVDVEPVRVGELAFVAVGGQQPRRDDRIRRDDLPGQFGLDHGHPADLGEREAVPEHLLDCSLHQRVAPVSPVV
ncbi:MAG TPA: hypothetical protein VJT72_11465 [Pseudonocardiaceae bacterium]|nr:hypothetical protein [Pseudonocardiaceae bacterium]